MISKIKVGSIVKHPNYNCEMKVTKATKEWITCERVDKDSSRVISDFKPEILTFIRPKPPMKINPNDLDIFNK